MQLFFDDAAVQTKTHDGCGTEAEVEGKYLREYNLGHGEPEFTPCLVRTLVIGYCDYLGTSPEIDQSVILPELLRHYPAGSPAGAEAK